MASIFHTGGDWVGVAEAAYRSSETDDEWALGVLDAVRGVIRAQWVSIICATFSEEHEPRMAAYGETFGEMGLRGLKELSMQDSAGFDLFFFPPSIINTQSSVDRRASWGTRRALRAYRAHFGIADALAAVANPTDRESAVLFAATHAPIALSRTNIELLTRAALHVEAGLRLRRHPEVIRAVVDTSGRAIHIEPGAPSRELLESHTRKVERARTRRARRAPEALDLWTALVDGRTSLIERFDGGKRYYLAVDNRHRIQPRHLPVARLFSSRERDRQDRPREARRARPARGAPLLPDAPGTPAAGPDHDGGAGAEARHGRSIERRSREPPKSVGADDSQPSRALAPEDRLADPPRARR